MENIEFSHGLLTKDELKSVRSHILDLSYIDSEKTYPKLFDKVKNKEINKKEFRILCMFFFE